MTKKFKMSEGEREYYRKLNEKSKRKKILEKLKKYGIDSDEAFYEFNKRIFSEHPRVYNEVRRRFPPSDQLFNSPLNEKEKRELENAKESLQRLKEKYGIE